MSSRADHLSRTASRRCAVCQDSWRTQEDCQLPSAFLWCQGGVTNTDHKGGAVTERPQQEALSPCAVSCWVPLLCSWAVHCLGYDTGSLGQWFQTFGRDVVTPSSRFKLSERNRSPIHAASCCSRMERVASTVAVTTLTVPCFVNANVLLVLHYVSEFDVCMCVCVVCVCVVCMCVVCGVCVCFVCCGWCMYVVCVWCVCVWCVCVCVPSNSRLAACVTSTSRKSGNATSHFSYLSSNQCNMKSRACWKRVSFPEAVKLTVSKCFLPEKNTNVGFI